MTQMRWMRPRLDWFVDRVRGRLALSRNQVKSDPRFEDLETLRKAVTRELKELDEELSRIAWPNNAGNPAAHRAIDECADAAATLAILADAIAHETGCRAPAEIWP